ncbi:MAG: ribosome assembly factor SBDS [Candidatus Aenigmarchaeota archaeon]|nr:ribosome assembly factor SBDS [Candidatus Aenigmarchaeota archaeon]
MVTVDKAIIARIEKKGKHFEVLVDPELAYDLRSGKQISVSGMLAVNEIFKDSKKGLKAGEGELREAFGNIDIFQIAEKIVKEGDIQLTTEFRKKKELEKKKQIAAFISKNAMDPRTKLPHPIERVLSAMDQAGVHVDPFHPVDKQIQPVIDAIKGIIPISMEKVKLHIHVPAKYSNQAYGVVKSFGTEGKWLDDGSLYAIIIIPAGLKDDVFSRLNKVTNGEVSIQQKDG